MLVVSSAVGCRRGEDAALKLTGKGLGFGFGLRQGGKVL